ncbi:hypothetical protein JCM11491_000560 [Sporobolomyces phaffii]
MSLRPPSTPRASLLPQGTPISRRRSTAATPTAAAAARPPSQLSSSQLDSLRQAVANHDPHDYGTHPGDVGVAIASDHPLPDSAERRKPVLPGARTAALLRASTPSGRRTPTTPAARPKTPNGFGSSTSRFPTTPATATATATAFQVGDPVSFEVQGDKMDGVVRFIGQVDGKAGEWGGVELSDEFAGRGKNDGSVKGVQYFACPPSCGLFLPLAKITAKPVPKPAATTRASKYAGMSARDLASRRTTLSSLSSSTAAAVESPPSPSKTPRRSLSPSKPAPRASLSPTKPPSYTTPKPATRLARPSLGVSTPSRKSLGPTGTPLAASSIKRPPSTTTTTMMAPPEVPPIPSAYGRTRSVTPSQMMSASGRVTPSTPGAMMRRRTSMASSVSSATGGGDRPSTPNLRSSSRQSFASSTSRTSSHHQQHHHNHDVVEELRRELDELRRREEDTRTLLEGSEHLGREMEDRLEEKERLLAARDETIRALKAEAEAEAETRNRSEPVSETRGGDGDESIRFEARVAELEREVELQTQLAAKVKLEAARKSAAKEAELESLRERIAASSKEHEDERLDLNQQVDKLRHAGQALCETYEEKIAEIELARLEAVELAETLQAQLEAGPGPRRSPSSSSLLLPRSASTNLAASTSHAAAIDAETALAEADHLRSKVAQLEEQLEDARTSLELELEEARDRRYKVGESEQALKGEIKHLKEIVDRSSQTESRLNSRIKELQIALNESQATLETERNELEGLRHEANGGSTSEDLKRVTRELGAAKSDFAALQQESSKNARLVDELRQDLRAAEKEIERLQRYEERDRRGSVASSIGGKDEMTSAKDQIVGLKSIVTTLTDENQQLVDRSKSLEEDAAELKATQRALEATVENLMNELSATPAQATTSSPSDSTSGSLRQELEQLRIELKEVQRRSDRDVKALNQEVSELEALVESKIYREDELETELEHYKSLVSKHAIPGSTASSSNGGIVSAAGPKSSRADDADDGDCEMCGESGHDLDSCPEFLGSTSPTKRRSPVSPTLSSSSLHHSRTTSTLVIQANGNKGERSQEWCDDCEEFGHALDNCPLAAEIF